MQKLETVLPRSDAVWKQNIVYFWYLAIIHLFLALSPVCHVLSGVAVPSSQRRADSHQACGEIPVCQTGGVCLLLVRECG